MAATRARYWVVAFALGMAVIAYIQRVSVSVAAGPISADLHLDKSQLGFAFGVFSLFYSLLEIPFGLMGDKVGVKRTLLRVVLACSVFTALTGAAWNFASFWMARLLIGAGEAGCFPNLTRMLSSWLPASERVKGQALMWAFARWGGAATPPLALLVMNALGWRMSFVAYAGLSLAWGAVFLWWYRDDPADHPAVNEEELALLQESRALVSHAGGPTWWQLLMTRDVALLCLQYFGVAYVWNFYITWLPLYLEQARGLSIPAAVGYATLPLLFGGFGSIISSFLPGWIPRRRLALFSLLTTSLMMLAIPSMPTVGLAMAAMALGSFASDLVMPVSWNACVVIGRAYTATVAGTMSMLGNLGGFFAPVVGGLILQHTANNWNMMVYVMAAVAAGSALCWLFLDPYDESRLPADAPLLAAPEP